MKPITTLPIRFLESLLAAISDISAFSLYFEARLLYYKKIIDPSKKIISIGSFQLSGTAFPHFSTNPDNLTLYLK